MIAVLYAVTPYLPLALAYCGYRLYKDVRKGDDE